jgi:hypothetical protein
MWKPKWEKTMECFLIYIKNSFIGSTNFPILQLQLEGGYKPLFIGSNLKESTSPRILWLQLEGCYNPMILKFQPEGSSNSLSYPASTKRRLKPPFLAQ